MASEVSLTVTQVRPFWRRKVFLATIAAVVLVAGGAVAIATSRTPEPVEVVRRYFAAIRERDVDKAFRVAGVERPTGEAAAFLVPEALNDDWDVVDIAPDGTYSRKAWVKVTLPMYPASKAKQIRGGQWTATTTVMLTKDDGWGGRWRLREPFSWTNARGTPLRYFEVNGKTVAAWAPTDTKQPFSKYVMLPGVYTFYRTSSDLLSFEPVKLTLMPGAGGGQQVEGPVVTLTPKGEEQARRQVNAYLDRCAGRVDLVAGAEPCPFNLGRNWSVETAEGRYTIVRDARWKVLRYPTLSMAVHSGGILITVAQPGLVQLTGNGFRDGVRGRQEFTTRCEVGDFGLVAGLVSPTELRLEPPARAVRATCRQPADGR